MNRQTKLFSGLVIVGAILLIGYTLILITKEREEARPPLMLKEDLYRLGDIVIDTVKGEIQFKAKVQKREGWVQHLVYLHGYKWIKEESAIIAQGKLSDLQKAIALLDWRLWDRLWYEKQITREKELLLFVQWDRKEIPAQELVLSEDKLEIGDFIFLGSPYFDHIALEASPGVDCRVCPIFPLEEKALRETFIRESGESGYELNSERMPPQGTEVTIIIKLSK
jgi:hypothetical protein